MSIDEASKRKSPGGPPAYEGLQIVVTGVIAGPVVNPREYSHVSLQDEQGLGVVLEAPRGALSQYLPGHRLRVTGEVGARSGLPVLRVMDIIRLGTVSAPVPARLPLPALTDSRNLGRYVEVVSRVASVSQTVGGDILSIRDGTNNVAVYLSREDGRFGGFPDISPGDKVRVLGMSSQYCPVPPYDRGFQIVIPNARSVTRISGGFWISSWWLLSTIAVVSMAALFWFRRERHSAQQRAAMRHMLMLSEDVISANSPREIARRLQAELPRVVGAHRVDLFLLDRSSHHLDRIPAEAAPEALSIDTDAPIGSFHAAVALCFRNKALLHVPDTRSSPILNPQDRQLPRAALFVPMLAHGEILGVVAISLRDVERHANPDRNAALQHLANQIAASLKLQQQQNMRDQLLRSEKMAAAGQLISGVANELRAPLHKIARGVRDVIAANQASSGEHLDEIASAAARGIETIDHLLSFARMERTEAKPLDLNGLVSSLLDLRESERTNKGITTENTIPLQRAEVVADQAQLEQALLAVIVHAEHAAANSPDRRMRVSSRTVGKRVQIAFESTAAASPVEEVGELALGDYFGFPVAQAVAQSHGGDLRYIPDAKTGCRLEFELPLQARTDETPTRSPSQKAIRTMTAVIVDPDPVVARKLLAMLAARGHRAIPADSAEHAADLVHRMVFDLVFCAVRLQGSNWVEFFHRIQRRVGAFILVTEAYDADAKKEFKAGEGYILPKPLEDKHLDELLSLIELRVAAARRQAG